jgi:hypothetical protein
MTCRLVTVNFLFLTNLTNLIPFPYTSFGMCSHIMPYYLSPNVAMSLNARMQEGICT